MVNEWINGLWQARKTGQRFTPDDNCPQTYEDAYSIQSGIAKQMGAVGGFKTARKPGERSIMAPIFSRDIVANDARIEVSELIGIELEVGLLLVADLPKEIADFSSSSFAEFLQPVVVIELVDTRIKGSFEQDQIAKLADNQINAGLVVGEQAAAWNGSDISVVNATFFAGTDQILDGKANVPGGAALKTFAILAKQIGTHCGGLHKGQIVITGSLHPLVYYPRGTEVQGEITGIGSVRVSLV